MRITSFGDFFHYLGAQIRRKVFRIRVQRVLPEDGTVLQIPVWFRCEYEQADRKDFSREIGTRPDGTQGYRTPTFNTAGQPWTGPDLHTLTLKHYNGMQILRKQADTKESVEAMMSAEIREDYFGKAWAASLQEFDRAQLQKATDERTKLGQWIISRHGESIFRSILEGMGDTRPLAPETDRTPTRGLRYE